MAKELLDLSYEEFIAQQRQQLERDKLRFTDATAGDAEKVRADKWRLAEAKIQQVGDPRLRWVWIDGYWECLGPAPSGDFEI